MWWKTLQEPRWEGTKMPRTGIFILCLLAASAAMACPTCKDALSNNPQGLGLAKGFYLTILLMLGMVFSLVGLLVYKIVKEAKKGPPQA